MSSLTEGRARLHGGRSESCAVTPVAPAVTKPGSKSAAELETKLRALTVMDGEGLRREWRRLYRSHPPLHIRRDLLVLAIAWKLQEKVHGGLRRPRSADWRTWPRTSRRVGTCPPAPQFA